MRSGCEFVAMRKQCWHDPAYIMKLERKEDKVLFTVAVMIDLFGLGHDVNPISPMLI